MSPVVGPAKEDIVPDNIQSLVQTYEPLFQEPKQLPPERALDHHIPLIPGATPVNIKPY
jgi:hypothetical protein